MPRVVLSPKLGYYQPLHTHNVRNSTIIIQHCATVLLFASLSHSHFVSDCYCFEANCRAPVSRGDRVHGLPTQGPFHYWNGFWGIQYYAITLWVAIN